MKYYQISLPGLCLALLANIALAENRWYNSDQLDKGQLLFEQNCTSCHGANADVPSLDGTSNSPKYSMQQLVEIIHQGSIQIGGSMPAFKGQLSDQEISHVIAFVQSKWPDDIYRQWAGQNPSIVSNQKTQEITQLLRSRLGNIDIAPAVETEIKGVYQTQFGDKYAYLIDGGRYVFIGDLIDLKKARNITEVSRRSDVKNTLAGVPLSDLVIFPARGEERTVLNVFTDTSCAYCQKLHTEVTHLQDAGISVRYFPFPRGGNRGPGYQNLRSVWCAKDGMQAMDIAKGVSSGQLPDGNCERSSSVDRGFDLGRKIGISGTPALYSAAGTKFSGYVPYNELIPMLLNEL